MFAVLLIPTLILSHFVAFMQQLDVTFFFADLNREHTTRA